LRLAQPPMTVDHDRHRALQARALAAGGKAKRLTEFEWSLAGGCTSPTLLSLKSRAYKPVGDRSRVALVGDPDYTSGQKHGRISRNIPAYTDLWVRCRKCDKCKGARAMHWKDRIIYELHHAQRTWFGTLTIAPDIQFRTLLEARRKFDQRSGITATPVGTFGPFYEDYVDKDRTFDQLSIDQQFQQQCGLLYREVQKYFKRIRKMNPSGFKYVVVFEKHTEKLSGFPHVHFLLHERSGAIKHRELSGQWSLGHTNFKLVEDEGAAAYIVKYLVKDAASKIRASTDYGREPQITTEARDPERIEWPRIERTQ
jgi:hypothetical protein